MLDSSAISGTETLSLMAVLIDPIAVAGSSPITSNALNVTFDISAATFTLNGDASPVQNFDRPSGIYYYKFDVNGNLVVDSASPAPGFNDYFLNGKAGIDVIQGLGGADIIAGWGGDDQIYGDVKIDTATAIANGNTDIATGQKGDWLAGNEGNDTVVGSTGNDVLTGGAGSDLLIAGAGDDFILGDADYTAALYSGGSHPYSPMAPATWLASPSGLTPTTTTQSTGPPPRVRTAHTCLALLQAQPTPQAAPPTPSTQAQVMTMYGQEVAMTSSMAKTATTP